MLAFSIVSFIEAYSLVLFGIYVIVLNPREKVNIFAALVYFSFAIWSFCYAFLFTTTDAQTAMMWHRIGVFGWGLFCPIATHFFLILSERAKKWKGIWVYVIIYALPAAIIINALFNPSGTSAAAGFARSADGTNWVYITNIKSVWYWIYMLQLVVYFSFALYSTYAWAKRSNRRRFIRQAMSIVYLDAFVLFIGAFLDLILPAFYSNALPLCHFVAFFWGIGFFFIVNSLKLMSPIDAATPDLIFRTVVDPILVLNSEGIIIKCNQATEDTLKYKSKQIINRPLSDFFKSKAYNRERIETLMSGKALRNADIDFLDADGKTIKTISSFTLAESKLDGVVGIVVNMHDITALKKVEKELNESNTKYMELSRQLDRLAHYDALTGMPNRRLLIERVDSAISEFEANGQAFALIFIDLDKFKAVNDAYGHDIGDKLLQRASEMFKSCIRKTDFVTRVGGDEFILFVYRQEGFELECLAQRIRDAFSSPIVIENCICEVGVSLGISKCPEDGVTRDELMRIADNRMYSEKSNKPGRS